MAGPPSEALAPRQATYQDVLDAPAHLVAEIVNGSLHTHPRPAPAHGEATSVLVGELNPPFHRGRGGPGGWRIHFEPELHLAEDILVPELAGWRRERMPELPRHPLLHPRPGLGLRGALALDTPRRSPGKAPHLRPRRCCVPVAHRPRGPDPGGIRPGRRRVGSHRNRERRRSGERAAVRRDHVQPRGPLGMTAGRLGSETVGNTARRLSAQVVVARTRYPTVPARRIGRHVLRAGPQPRNPSRVGEKSGLVNSNSGSPGSLFPHDPLLELLLDRSARRVNQVA